MNTKQKSISTKLIIKLSLSFFLMMMIAGFAYVLITIQHSNMYVKESRQKLNAHLAESLIKEKFQNVLPFDSAGNVNKAFFGDLMHDMMAVNPAIEVYLLDDKGLVLYSVVLDHSKPEIQQPVVNTVALETFINSAGNEFVLGDDPRVPGEQQIFSAARYSTQNKNGYIYIILAGKEHAAVQGSLLSSYCLKLGAIATGVTILITSLLGILVIFYLTRNLREIITAVRRFKEGDLEARVRPDASKDLDVLASTFNEMADTIVGNIQEIQFVENFRAELIANMSHDLRSPIAVSQGYIETMLMKQNELTKEDQAEYLTIVFNRLKKLSKQIDRLFEYSKLEANQIKPEKQPFMVYELVSDVVANYQLVSTQKNIKLVAEIEPNLPLVFADIGLVERVFQNLIENAIKFTPEGGQISIFIEQGSKNVKVRVKDSGPGIDPSDQIFIFERFRQVEKTSKKGSGLGLAIVKKILEIHDCTIEVISKPHEGAIFEFDLPNHPSVQKN